MIGGVIILLTLIIALFEKPHLFKKPVKAEKVVILSILLLTAIFSTCKECKSDKQQDHDSAVIDSLSGRSIVLDSMVNKLSIRNEMLHQQHAESLSAYHYNTVEIMGRYGLKVDTLTNTIVKLDDKVLKETPPTLRIVDYPTLTKMYEHKENALDFTLQALNADVHILDYAYIYINLTKRGLDTPKVHVGNSMNYTTIIAKGETSQRTVFLDRQHKLTNPFFIAIEIYYKSKGNKVQVPVRKIYLVDISKNIVREADNSLHQEVSLHLKKHKIWEKFYDL